jgi:hypothetical protein
MCRLDLLIYSVLTKYESWSGRPPLRRQGHVSAHHFQWYYKTWLRGSLQWRTLDSVCLPTMDELSLY